jgi:hypothetical protein
MTHLKFAAKDKAFALLLSRVLIETPGDSPKRRLAITARSFIALMRNRR